MHRQLHLCRSAQEAEIPCEETGRPPAVEERLLEQLIESIPFASGRAEPIVSDRQALRTMGLC
ncbi:MAG: hypothetical protein ACXWNX_07705, partial [Isosphaeraceae bacterium]